MVRRLLRKALHRDLAHAQAQVLRRIATDSRIASAMARAAATAATRQVDPKRPLTWEFTGFSQHGEDGIVDFLCSNLTLQSRFFFEIGAADGLENCTAWLVFARQFGGVWVEGDPDLSRRAIEVLDGRVWNVHAINRFVDADALPGLMKMCPHKQPDLMSIDIDSTDYHIARRVLDLGFRPKIWVVEYNSAFGPERRVSVPYGPRFNRWQHPSGLYYGCSVAGWRSLFEPRGYRFVTVDSSGTNALFLDPDAFPPGFADALQGIAFRDNDGDLNASTRPVLSADGSIALPSRDWRSQYRMIADLPLIEVG